MLIDPMSMVFGTPLTARMFIGIVMIIFYLGLVEIIHFHRPKEEMRKIFLPITITLLIIFLLIILRKLIS